MKPIKQFHKIIFACILPGSLVLSGCFHEDDTENMTPTATATTAASAAEASVVTLNGSGTGDGALSYAWSQKSGTLAVLKNTDSADASFIAPVLDLTNTTETLVFELTVTDADAETATAEVSIMVDLDTTISKYKVTTTNITNGQPLTPIAAVLHDSTFRPWAVGSAASTGLEILAESGSPREFVTESVNDNSGAIAAGAADGIAIPGASKTVLVGATASASHMLSIASMLANTNDAFSGVQQLAVGGLAVDETETRFAHVYDAGTEKNTESSGTVAGPADASTAADKGFSATRDDPSSFVSLHGGVVTVDDGLSTSVLDESHRWMTYAAKIEVTRIQ